MYVEFATLEVVLGHAGDKDLGLVAIVLHQDLRHFRTREFSRQRLARR
jgi:hypothetical protein